MFHVSCFIAAHFHDAQVSERFPGSRDKLIVAT